MIKIINGNEYMISPHAYLSGDYLRGAFLRGADLSWAYLSWADLSGAKIRDGIEIQKTPLQMIGQKWNITIWDSHMQIGCEFHTLDDWFQFDDRVINAMSRHALKFWRNWKAPIMGICIAENRYRETP